MMNVTEEATIIIECFKRGNKVLICGNGGSATQASHMAGEFLGKFEMNRKPLPAISLFDLAGMTAIANDMGYEHIFSRPLQALGKGGDVLVTFSTSGKSNNILNAIEQAENLRMIIIQAPLHGLQNSGTAAIQEYHLQWLHEICRIVEKECV